MAKLLPFILILFYPFVSFSQNWNCFTPGTKQFFTNSNTYLRGVRIDSVTTDNTDTIYHLFRTPRGKSPYSSVNTGVDSNGGSWLGKNVIRHSDGTFIFDDIWSDSIVVKTSAGLGDSWTFYSDTSSISYVANVVAVDTATISGGLDSIKSISISAFQGTNIINNDPRNILKIVLSKAHGFVNAFDLYTFPYVDSTQAYFFNDYYFYWVSATYNNLHIINSTQQFRRVDFHYPLTNEIFDYAPGDILKRDIYSNRTDFNNVMTEYSQDSTTVDSIMTKTISSSLITYTTKTSARGGYGSPIYSRASVSHIFSSTLSFVLNQTVFDTSLMPEEFGVVNIFLYKPEDSTNCSVGPFYRTVTNGYRGDSIFANLPPSGTSYSYNDSYKIGGGNSSNNSTSILSGTVDLESGGSTTICKKNGTVCQNCLLVDAVPRISINNNLIEIYPNPARDYLTITLPEASSGHSVYLFDLLGQKVFFDKTNQKQNVYPIKGLADGLYILKIVDEYGMVDARKIAIQH